jgi:septal ring factor EnvC (AmiA/AmiB activator)
MTAQALLSALVLSAGLSVTGEVLAGNELSPEQLAKAREAARQLTPPVDFDALMKKVDQFGVECTGDLTRKVRIDICTDKVKNAKTEADTQATRARIEATKADTEATQARIEATRARIEATEARIEKIDKENAELIREIQRRIKEDK